MNEQKPVVVGDIKPSVLSKLKSRLKNSANKKETRRRPKSLKLGVVVLVFLMLVGGGIYTYRKINSKPKNPNTVMIDGKTYDVKLLMSDPKYAKPVPTDAKPLESLAKLKAETDKDPNYVNCLALASAYLQAEKRTEAITYLKKAKSLIKRTDPYYTSKIQNIDTLLKNLESSGT